MVDDDRTAGGQADLTGEGQFDLALDLVAREQRNGILVELQAPDVVRHHGGHEFPRLLVDGRVVHQDLVDVGAQVVAQRADDDVAFLVDQEGRLTFAGGLLDGAPELQEIAEIPLQFLGGAPHAGGAHDDAHALWDFQIAHDFAHLVPLLALDASRDAAGAGVVGHQHQIAAGQADEGGEGRTLGAALLFLDLHDDFLPLAEQFGDVELAAEIGARLEVFPRDFLQRQKAVALPAVFDEAGIQAGLDAGDASFVDVGFFLFSRRRLDVQIEQFLSFNQRDPQFFGLRGVDQHSFHGWGSHGSPARFRRTADPASGKSRRWPGWRGSRSDQRISSSAWLLAANGKLGGMQNKGLMRRGSRPCRSAAQRQVPARKLRVAGSMLRLRRRIWRGAASAQRVTVEAAIFCRWDPGFVPAAASVGPTHRAGRIGWNYSNRRGVLQCARARVPPGACGGRAIPTADRAASRGRTCCRSSPRSAWRRRSVSSARRSCRASRSGDAPRATGPG